MSFNFNFNFTYSLIKFKVFCSAYRKSPQSSPGELKTCGIFFSKTAYDLDLCTIILYKDKDIFFNDCSLLIPLVTQLDELFLRNKIHKFLIPQGYSEEFYGIYCPHSLQ